MLHQGFDKLKHNNCCNIDLRVFTCEPGTAQFRSSCFIQREGGNLLKLVATDTCFFM